MKKLKYLILTVILLFSCLGLTAFAEGSAATISDDYQTLCIDGNTYSRFDTSMINIDYYALDFYAELTASQQEIINEVEVELTEDSIIAYATIYFKDGATLSAGFLRDDYLKMYNELSASEDGEYLIDFQYPEDNIVPVEKSKLFGNPVVLGSEDLEWCDYYPVVMKSEDGNLSVYKGSILFINDDCYYVNYEEIGVKTLYEFDPYEYDELPAYEISDEELIASIREGESDYYADDFGFFYDDNFTETLSAVFLIFVFAIIPFAILVVFLILAIRSKTVYRKMFATISILSGMELTIFAIITAFIMMYR